MKAEEGSIVLEAAMILPFFVAFLLAMAAMMSLSTTEAALQIAVSEAVKVTAANMYPVDLVYRELANSTAYRTAEQYVGQLMEARRQVAAAEQWIDHYSQLIPEPVWAFVQAERTAREGVEQLALQELEQSLAQLFTPMLHWFADEALLRNKNSLRVQRVSLPALGNRGRAFFGLEATYELKLPIPFFTQTIRLHKSAYERVWIGA